MQTLSVGGGEGGRRPWRTKGPSWLVVTAQLLLSDQGEKVVLLPLMHSRIWERFPIVQIPVENTLLRVPLPSCCLCGCARPCHCVFRHFVYLLLSLSFQVVHSSKAGPWLSQFQQNVLWVRCWLTVIVDKHKQPTSERKTFTESFCLRDSHMKLSRNLTNWMNGSSGGGALSVPQNSQVLGLPIW